MVLVEEREPRVRCELVVVHAREGVGVVEVGAVALVQLEQRVGDLAEDAAPLDRDARVADGRQVELVVKTPLETVEIVVVVHEPLHSGCEADRENRVARAQILLVKGRAVDFLVVREAHAHMERRARNRADGAAVGAQQRHVAVAVDPLEAGAERVAQSVYPFVLVERLGAVDHREALVPA